MICIFKKKYSQPNQSLSHLAILHHIYGHSYSPTIALFISITSVRAYISSFYHLALILDYWASSRPILSGSRSDFLLLLLLALHHYRTLITETEKPISAIWGLTVRKTLVSSPSLSTQRSLPDCSQYFLGGLLSTSQAGLLSASSGRGCWSNFRVGRHCPQRWLPSGTNVRWSNSGPEPSFYLYRLLISTAYWLLH